MARNFCEDGGVSENKEGENLEATKAEAEKPIRIEDCEIKVTKVNIMGMGEKYLEGQWNPETEEIRLAITDKGMNEGVFISLRSVDKEMADASQFPYGPGEILSIAPDTYDLLARRTKEARKKENSKVEATKRALKAAKGRIFEKGSN